MLENLLQSISVYLEANYWLAPVFSLVAGFLTAFTPCSLANIPLVIFYVGNTGKDNKGRALQVAVFFALGNTVAFLAMGIIAVLFGNLVLAYMRYFYIFLGILMVLMALQLWELYDILSPVNLLGRIKSKGAVGAFLAGMLGGVFASPCATPVLVVLLSMLALKGSFLYGLVLMLFYALGNSFVIMVVGCFTTGALQLLHNSAYKRIAWYSQLLMGLVALGVALYMFYLGF